MGEGFPTQPVYEEGFTQENAQKWNLEDAAALELRGCLFQHTSKRELYMTEKIEAILRSENIVSANKSVGFWRYAENFE